MSYSAVAHELFDKGILAAALALIVWQWKATLSLTSVGVKRSLKKSWALLSRSHQYAALVFAFTLSVICLADGLVAQHWIAFPFALFGISLFVVSTVLLPPVVMVLGVSRAASTRLFVRHICWKIAPLRSVHFLLVQGVAGADPLFFLSNARARSPHKWQDSVELAASLVSVVLIDVSIPTDQVEEEAENALDPELVEKSVFVGNHENPVLKRIAVRLGIELPAVRVASRDQAARWIKRLRRETLRSDIAKRGNPADRILIGTRRKVHQRMRHMCGEIRDKLAGGPITADEVNRHVAACGICRFDPLPRTTTTLHTDHKFDPETFPNVLIVGVERFLDRDLFRRVARDPQNDLIVFSGDSPGARHPSWCIDIIKLFALDPGLGLVVEKDRIQPITLDPVIAVRRRLIESWEPPPLALHLSEIARAMEPHVLSVGFKVRHESLIELPRASSGP